MSLHACRDLPWGGGADGVARGTGGRAGQLMGRPEHADDRVKIRAELEAGSTKGGEEIDIVVAEAHFEALGVGRSQAPLDEEMRITPVAGVDLGGDRARSIGPRPTDQAVFPKQQHDPFGEPRPRQRPAQPARMPLRRPGPACDILHEGHIGEAGERASADRPHNTTVGHGLWKDPDGFHWPVRRAPLPIPLPITAPSPIPQRDQYPASINCGHGEDFGILAFAWHSSSCPEPQWPISEKRASS